MTAKNWWKHLEIQILEYNCCLWESLDPVCFMQPAAVVESMKK